MLKKKVQKSVYIYLSVITAEPAWSDCKCYVKISKRDGECPLLKRKRGSCEKLNRTGAYCCKFGYRYLKSRL